MWSIFHSTLFFWLYGCCRGRCKSKDYTRDKLDSVIYKEKDTPIPAEIMDAEEEKREEEHEDNDVVDVTAAAACDGVETSVEQWSENAKI
jgi:hypothetical protein